MNLLFFSHSSDLGGAERSLIELINELTNDYNLTCTVVLPNEGPVNAKVKAVGAKTIIAPMNWWCQPSKRYNDVEITQQLVESLNWLYNNLEVIEKHQPDIILTNTLVIPWGSITAHLLKKPHIWMVNEFGELDHNLRFVFSFKEILNFIVESSDMVITRSKAVKNELFPNSNDEKVKTIYRYIKIPEKNKNSDSPTKKYFTKPEHCHILIMGGITSFKGQEDAVRSIIELVSVRKQKVELIIVGNSDPDYKKMLDEMIKANQMEEYIQILPFKENIFPLLEQADIVLSCSKMEAFGRVILESLLMEKPVIATNCGGTPEMIKNEITGLLYDPGNYVQLADQIELLIENPKLKNNIAKNGKEYANKTFTKNNFGGEYVKTLEALINNKYKTKRNIIWFEKSLINKLDNFLILPTEQVNIINTLKEEVLNLEKRCYELESRNKSLKEEVLYYALSKSWRITRPLRKLMSFFRGKRNA